MDINQALEKLYSMRQFNIKLGLENIEGLLQLIGNPHLKLKIFHIAGSNGKGSTASFLSSLLIEHGYKTALYTSPHLVKFNERIKINGELIDDDYIGKFIQEIDDYINRFEPTFFEITTALAFKYFADNNVDYAVIEVGLGGRLDATNLIKNPVACVITSISLEHTNILGTEISKIAWEKAGIIKENSKVYIGKLNVEAEESIVKVVLERFSELIKLSDYKNYSNESLKLNIDNNIFTIYEQQLLGEHQIYNAALAVLVFSKSIKNYDFTKISKGLYNVVKNTGHSCRLEKINSSPDIIFDAAHNVEGIESLLSFIRKRKNKYSEMNILFGVSNDKNYSDMILKLAEVFDNFYITSFNYPKAATILEIQNICKKNNIKVTAVNNKVEFIKRFKLNSKTDSVLFVLGSIYMLGEILSQKSLKFA